MAKVGILTFHWSNHMGAVLQTYALSKTIEHLRHEVRIINFHPNLELIVSPVVRPDKLATKYRTLNLPFWEKVKSMFGEVIYYLPSMASEIGKTNAFNFFREYYLKIEPRERIVNLNDLRCESSNYEVVMVGSDQVWNPRFLKYSDYAYLLPFKLANTVKIGFSTSIGIDVSSIPKELLGLYRKTLRNFAFISVREYRCARELSKILNREVYCTLDPTLLVPKNVFEEIASKHLELVPKSYVLFYNLDPSILPYTEVLEKLFNLPVIIYKSPNFRERRLYEKWLRDKISFHHMGPQEFIALLKNAKLIFTNSYHGLTLSILFEKPVIVTISGLAFEAKLRIEDLVYLLGLRSRLVKNASDIVMALNEDIDYCDIGSRLRELRKRSIKLLKKVLKHEDISY